MKTLLKMPDALFMDLIAHLLRPDSIHEEAAFLFVNSSRFEDHVNFEVVESMKLTPEDFETQESDYLELKDTTRARLIKRAHDLGASLVEMHSHPGARTAAFSLADRVGLQETVPHMWWRLRSRPYVAIVVARNCFDALVWLDDPKIPLPLGGILAGEHLRRPTNQSLKGWT
ncbi:Mov34/MPN/PAD-1 family protein [Reyranella sp.]|uniref:Mov34/MPN/PAD-1 family protein n=1 Tax=Reyranella sp. TaxID=1929291 RepID=UPI0025CDA58A|nr:Mov34/MPN/PAD-1 family protein [Reyranella sp.]